VNFAPIPALQHSRKWQVWLLAVVLALLLTETIVAAMSWLLRGVITWDYLLTGLVASLIVASLVSGITVLLLEKMASLDRNILQLNTIIDALPIPIALFDADRRILRLNPAFSNAFGYLAADLPDVETWRRKAYPDSDYRYWVTDEWQRRLNCEPPRFEPLELKVFCKNGITKNVVVTVTPLGPLCDHLHLVVLYDVSERVEAMNALAESRNLLQLVIETIPLRVFWKDRASRYLGCNALFAEDSGAPDVATVIGKVDTQLAWYRQAELYRRDDRWVIESGQAKLAYEEPQITSDHGECVLRTSKAPLRNRRGETIGVLGVYDDITEFKQIESELWFTRAMVDKSKTAFYWLDENGRITYINDYACETLGYSRAELLGMFPWQFNLDLSEADWPMLWQRLQAEEIVVLESRHRRKDGTLVPVEVTGHYIRYGDRSLMFAFAQNISERKQAETQLRIAATAFESQEGMAITDADAVILKINLSFSEMTGYTPADAVGRNLNLLHSDIHDGRFYDEVWSGLRRNGVWQGELWNRHKNGTVFPVWQTMTAVRGADGAITHFVAAMTDISERKAIEDHVHHLAHHDPLTDLPNRILLSDRLRQALAQARREQTRLALIYLDLDQFKPVNDGYGHDIGDLLLQDVACRLRACVRRESDTVSRLGGDEFVVLLPQIDGERDVVAISEKILEALSRPFSLEQYAVNISTSLGIAIYPNHGADVKTLMKHADQAMYQAKCAGKGCYRFYGDSAATPAGDG